LHGWGVVCGAIVCPVFDSKKEMTSWLVNVSPGYILGPYGDEIVRTLAEIFCGIIRGYFNFSFWQVK